MNKDIEEKIKKLPQWAQSEISRLDSSLNTVNKQIAQYEGNAETKIHRLGIGKDIPVPDFNAIGFKVDNGSIDISIVDGELRVYTNHLLIVKPRASNSVYLSVAK